MDNKFDYTETIENYIRGEMSGDQKLQFENQLNQDPLLKEELVFQQDLIQSIQDVRKTELKSRLDGVQIGLFDGVTSTAGFKILATAVITTVIGVGSYYAFFNESSETSARQEETAQIIEEEPKETKPVVVEAEDKKKQPEETNMDSAAAKKEPQLIAKAEPKEEKPQPVRKEKKAEPTVQKVEEDKDSDINPVIPDLSDNFAEEDSTPDNDIDIPDNELGPGTTETRANFEIETRTDSRNQFHYRFRSGKLILYGDFSGSTYEIIELNSSIGKSYYLYYDNNFYPLNVENTKITELRVLTDKTLIEELKKIKGSN
jgi:hypothetical protein